MHVDECGECIIKCIILPDRMYVVNKIYLHQFLNVSSFQAQGVRSGTMPKHFFLKHRNHKMADIFKDSPPFL